MEAGMGQKYGLQLNNAAIAANPSSAVDLLTITAAASVPIYIERLLLSAPVNQAQSVAINFVVRSSAGTGGSTSLISAVAEPPSGPTVSATLAYGVTTPGALVKTVGSGSWQLFGQYVFTRKPGALLITPGQTFAITVAAVGIGSGFNMNIEGEFTEVK